MSQLHHDFFDEAHENLDVMEQGLLSFSPQSGAREQLNAIFRAAHSVKGGAAAFGFSNVAEFAHLMESLLDRLRVERREPDAQTIDLLLESVDAMRSMLARHRVGAAGPVDTPAALVRRLRAVALAPDPAPGARSLEVCIGPVERVEDVDALLVLFRDIPGLGEARELPGPGSGIRRFALRTDSSDEELLALFAFHVSRDLVSIRAVAALETPDAGKPASATDYAEPGCSVMAAPDVPLPESAHLATIRVASSKVDHLVGLADAIVRIHTMLERDSRALDPAAHAQLLADLGELRVNTLELQRSALAIRMMPIALVFNRFPRMLRDLAQKLGKKFTLLAQGDGTELDKAVVQKIADPLMHLVRNSCDHGIETPAERVALGKPEAGTITLSFASQQDTVTIEVRDDGRGLARDRILEAARVRGLEVSGQLADGALWQLVFEPGFSTAASVTDVSGRGVGLDVVKRNVAALGGVVRIESTPGQGTCVSMLLPLGRH